MSDEASDALEVPDLFPCLTCAMPVQSGNGPGDLAWHDCEFIARAKQEVRDEHAMAGGPDALLDAVTKNVIRRVHQFQPRDLADLVRSMADLQKAKGGGGGQTQDSALDLLAFLAREGAALAPEE